MKNLFLLAFLFFASSFFGPVRNVSASTTIQTSDDNGVVANTGGDVTFTLGTVSSGFMCTVANHGTGTITFSGAITVANGKTITTLQNSNSTFTPDNIGNSIFLWYDGTTWRGR